MATKTPSKKVAKPRYNLDQKLQVFELHASTGEAYYRTVRLARERLPFARSVTIATLKRWINELPDEYARIRTNAVNNTYEEEARLADSLAFKQSEIEQTISDQLADALDNGEISAKDLSGTLKNVSIAKGINIDKSMVARGRPTSISASVEDFEAAMKRLQESGLVPAIESTATEIPVDDQTGD